jgi:hypothetical protein
MVKLLIPQLLPFHKKESVSPLAPSLFRFLIRFSAADLASVSSVIFITRVTGIFG